MNLHWILFAFAEESHYIMPRMNFVVSMLIISNFVDRITGPALKCSDLLMP
jgi:hypothetical protein